MDQNTKTLLGVGAYARVVSSPVRTSTQQCETGLGPERWRQLVRGFKNKSPRIAIAIEGRILREFD